jgi:hypothetical protein
MTPMTTATTTTTTITITEAARQLCQEARIVLCSLRGGPPAVARGELAHDLQDVRVLVRAHIESIQILPQPQPQIHPHGTQEPGMPSWH